MSELYEKDESFNNNNSLWCDLGLLTSSENEYAAIKSLESDQLESSVPRPLSRLSLDFHTVTDSQLQLIGRAVFACVDLDAIVNNVLLLKKHCRNPQVGVLGVVKANACGHGAVEVSKYLIKTGAVERLAVANVPEAIQLRRAGVEGAIHVLGNTQAWEMDSCIQNELIPTVSTSEAIKGMAEALKRYRRGYHRDFNQQSSKSEKCMKQLKLNSTLDYEEENLLQILYSKLIDFTTQMIKTFGTGNGCKSYMKSSEKPNCMELAIRPSSFAQENTPAKNIVVSFTTDGKEIFEQRNQPRGHNFGQTEKILGDTEPTSCTRPTCNDTNLNYKSGIAMGTVHIKLDTGMTRNGCQPGELDFLVQTCRNSGVHLEGMFTHICNHEDDDYSRFQVSNFQKATEKYKDQGILFHISNSGSVLWDIGTDMDMIRPGLSMFGMSPGMDLDKFASLGFRPALSVKGTLTLVKLCSRGTKVGYGCTYTCPEDEWIATFPLGYADGFSRDLGHSGLQYVVRDATGEKCPVVGRVSMDAITVKVPQDIQPGELFTFVSADFDPVSSIAGMAQNLRSIEHEISVRITSRLPRVYSTQSSQNIYSINPALNL